MQVLRIVVASPGDVQPERKIVEEVAAELNRGIAKDFGLYIEISRWETDAFPGFHIEGPQGLIDSVLNIEDCSLLIGIFWKRFGTPTADAKSGTEHEFRRAYETWQRNRHPQIMVYFNEKPYSPKTKAETDQWGQVLEFKREFPREGLWWSYNGKLQFEKLLRNHLTQYIRRMPAADADLPRLTTENHVHPSAKRRIKNTRKVLDTQEYAISVLPKMPTITPNASASQSGKVAEAPKFVLLHTLRGHSGWISNFMFSRDSQVLISAGHDETIKVWRLGTWELLYTYKHERNFTIAFTISPHGQYFADLDGDTIKVVRLSTGKLLHGFDVYKIRGMNRGLTTLISFSPDGQFLIAKNNDDTIHIWHLETEKLLYTLDGYSSRAYNVAVSSDGKTLAHVNEDGTLAVWDWQIAKLLHTFSCDSPIKHLDQILPNGKKITEYDIIFSPDGRTLVSSHEDEKIRLWQNSGLRCTLNAPYASRITFNPDGQILVTMQPSTTNIWNVNTGQLIGTLMRKSTSIHKLAIAPNGQNIAVGNRDGMINVYEKRQIDIA